MTNIDSIFVYGTLKQGHLKASMWPCKPLSIVPAIIRAALYDTGPYPAILSGDDCVLGELWKMAIENMQQTLSVLDEVEGYRESRKENLYIRIEADATLKDGSIVRAYTYQYACAERYPSLRRINSTQTFADQLCAVWPDSQSRIPKMLLD